MLVQVKKLQYWKTEHQDMNRCQDACELAPERGLFAVADGAGTTLFPALWAHILAQHFIDIPLMSRDPFEVEWWVRLAQEQYRDRMPKIEESFDWSVRAKAQNQGSDSTLATLRIFAVDAASAQAELLIFGDSCVIIGDTQTNTISSFVLQQPDEFNLAPVCIPSALKFFNRLFNQCSVKSVQLQPHHIAVLATDAVSKWIISGGNSHYPDRWDAFQKVCRSTEKDWPEFIEECRQRKAMVDDDSTALLLTFKEDGYGEGIPLGLTISHSHPVMRGNTAIDIIQERKEVFQKAQQDKNNELVAIYYGDGTDLKPLVNTTEEEIQHARDVADALSEVLRAFRHAQNNPGLVAKVEPVWRRYGHLLQHEKCADNIRATLQRNGVNLTLPGQEQQTLQEPDLTLANGNMIPPLLGLPGKPVSSLPVQATSSSSKSAEPSSNIGENEKNELERGFLLAVRENNDDNLLVAVDALDAARSRYPGLLKFTPDEEMRIKRIRDRKLSREKLQKALQSGLVENIAAAYDPQIDTQSLSIDEQNKLVWARQLAEVFKNEDEPSLLTIYNRIHNQQIFTFTEAEQQFIKLALQRLEAYKYFSMALQTRRLFDIAKVFDPILDNSQRLSQEEREIVTLAREFVAAYEAHNDDDLVAAYKEIQKTSYGKSLALTDEERKRIADAEMSMQTVHLATVLTVATVKGKNITLDKLRKICRIKEMYVQQQILLLQQVLSTTKDIATRQKIEERIADYRAGIDSEHLPTLALNDIINDVVIQAKIAEEKQLGVPLYDFDLDKQLPIRLEQFKMQVGPDYEAILKRYRLTEEDVIEALSLLLRRELFVAHFHNLQEQRRWYSFPSLKGGQKSMPLEEWLARERKEAEVKYTQFGIDPDQRGLWLFKQLQQIKE